MQQNENQHDNEERRKKTRLWDLTPCFFENLI